MRVFDTSQLGNRSVFGDAAKAYGAAASVIDDYDQRKRRKKLQARDDIEYRDSKERQKLLQGRDDTAYRQSQDDREQFLADSETARSRERTLFSNALEDRKTRNQRQSEAHSAAMYREQDFKNSAGYRRELEKVTLAGRKAQKTDAEISIDIKRMDLKQKKVAHTRAMVAEDARKVDALISNGASPTKINAAIKSLSARSGINIDTIDGDHQLVNGLGEQLASGTQLDDPNLLPALQVLWKPLLQATGRGDKYRLAGMRNTGEGSYIPQFEYTDGSGKVGFQTHGASTEQDDLLEKFTAEEILEKATEHNSITKQLKTVRDTYGLNAAPEKRETTKLGKDDRLVDSQTGEVITGSSSGSSGEPVSKKSEILMKSYEEDGDVQGQIAHSLLAEKGIVSQQAVAQAKEIAGSDGDIESAATLVASRTKRAQVVDAGPAPAKAAMKRRIEQYPDIKAEDVDLVTDGEMKKILKRFAKSDSMTQEELFGDIAEAARQRAQKEQKRAEAKTKRVEERSIFRQALRRAGQDQLDKLQSLNERMMAQ